tara:strand:+ start:4088 stop:4432 length:345 start_codon:yes stop_codon:yes gene_type:complete
MKDIICNAVTGGKFSITKVPLEEFRDDHQTRNIVSKNVYTLSLYEGGDPILYIGREEMGWSGWYSNGRSWSGCVRSRKLAVEGMMRDGWLHTQSPELLLSNSVSPIIFQHVNEL